MNNFNDNYAPDINPATGLPMVEDSCIDVGGSLYGYDNEPQPWTPSPSYDISSPGFDTW